MKNEALYNGTINILAKAFRDGTLEHGSCMACAVGNIIQANLGSNVFSEELYEWYKFLVDSEGNARLYLEYHSKESLFLAKQQISSTGYTIDEVREIERAFEGVRKWSREKFEWSTQDKDGFLGLMAVVDALDIIHENTDASITNKSKQQIENKLVLELA